MILLLVDYFKCIAVNVIQWKTKKINKQLVLWFYRTISKRRFKIIRLNISKTGLPTKDVLHMEIKEEFKNSTFTNNRSFYTYKTSCDFPYLDIFLRHRDDFHPNVSLSIIFSSSHFIKTINKKIIFSHLVCIMTLGQSKQFPILYFHRYH